MCGWGLVESKSSMPSIRSSENAFLLNEGSDTYLCCFIVFPLFVFWLVSWFLVTVLDRHRSGVKYDDTRLMKKI